jgi:hypothetical protein
VLVKLDRRLFRQCRHLPAEVEAREKVVQVERADRDLHVALRPIEAGTTPAPRPTYQPIEEQPMPSRLAPVEPGEELVEVAVEVLLLADALVRAE